MYDYNIIIYAGAVCTYLHANVGLCADESVHTSLRVWGAHVRVCVALVSACA